MVEQHKEENIMCWLSVGQRQPPTHPWRNKRWAETGKEEMLEMGHNIVFYFKCTVYPLL